MRDPDRDLLRRLAPLEESVIERAREAFAVTAGPADAANLVPGGFERYCKVLHPPSLPDGSGDLEPSTWQALAAAVGVALDPSTSGVDLVSRYSEMIGPVEEPWLGSFTETVSSGDRVSYRLRVGELARCLHGQHGEERLLSIGVSALVGDAAIGDGWPSGLLASRPFTFATLDRIPDLDSSLDLFTGVVWPIDLSWWITSDIDLDHSLVGGSAELVERCLTDGRFEALPIE